MGCDVSLLAGIEIFELLHGDDKRALADVVDAIKLNPAETLFHAGEPGDALFVVRSGSIELFIKDTAGQKIV
jgi:CRP-like cAMP-binding protein